MYICRTIYIRTCDLMLDQIQIAAIPPPFCVTARSIQSHICFQLNTVLVGVLPPGVVSPTSSPLPCRPGTIDSRIPPGGIVIFRRNPPPGVFLPPPGMYRFSRRRGGCLSPIEPTFFWHREALLLLFTTLLLYKRDEWQKHHTHT